MLDEDPEEVISLGLGNKLYEMSNHLGNVLTVINDIKVPQFSNSVDVDGYLATIVSTADYSPFGVQLDERTVSAESYRFGFQGQEKDDDIKGAGNSVNYEFRMYSTRLGRWSSCDPLNQLIGSQYSAFGNSPILLYDTDGRWIPMVRNGQIYIQAESGDNLTTLWNFFGDKDEAKNYLQKRDMDKLPKMQIIDGTILQLNSDNIFSKTVQHSFKNPEKYVSFEDWNKWANGKMTSKDIKDFQKKLNDSSLDNYNCHMAALSFAMGKLPISSELSVELRNIILKYCFINVDESQAEFGKSVITFGHQHSATFFGSDNDGNIYVFTKNGPNVAPSIMKLSELQEIGGYGVKRNAEVTNYSVDATETSLGSGIYNIKE